MPPGDCDRSEPMASQRKRVCSVIRPSPYGRNCEFDGATRDEFRPEDVKK